MLPRMLQRCVKRPSPSVCAPSPGQPLPARGQWVVPAVRLLPHWLLLPGVRPGERPVPVQARRHRAPVWPVWQPLRRGHGRGLPRCVPNTLIDMMWWDYRCYTTTCVVEVLMENNVNKTWCRGTIWNATAQESFSCLFNCNMNTALSSDCSISKCFWCLPSDQVPLNQCKDCSFKPSVKTLPRTQCKDCFFKPV
jgi:hypothetical protein